MSVPNLFVVMEQRVPTPKVLTLALVRKKRYQIPIPTLNALVSSGARSTTIVQETLFVIRKRDVYVPSPMSETIAGIRVKTYPADRTPTACF